MYTLYFYKNKIGKKTTERLSFSILKFTFGNFSLLGFLCIERKGFERAPECSCLQLGTEEEVVVQVR